MSGALFDVSPGPLAVAAGEPVEWRAGTLREANRLLPGNHYLGPARGAQLVFVGMAGRHVVATQVWRNPSSRNLPADGTWFELSRWCLTPAAGKNAGSRNHAAVLPLLKQMGAHTLVSYSDPAAGHTGALYRACNWIWAPTWLRLRPPPTGNGSWGVEGNREAVKDRWVFHVTKQDPARAALVVTDQGALRYWRANGTEVERRWATRSPYVPEEASKR